MFADDEEELSLLAGGSSSSSSSSSSLVLGLLLNKCLNFGRKRLFFSRSIVRVR